MKHSVICLAFGVSLFPISVQAQHLRKRSLGNDEDNGTVSMEQRDEELLNSLIQVTLPRVNAAIELFAPEPMATDHIAGTYNIASSRVPFWCKSASFDIDYSSGELFGLSNFSIGNVTVEPGTVGVNPGLFNSTWTGTFNMAVATPSTLMANDVRATLRASCAENGKEQQWAFGGTMVALEPSVSGLIDMTGTLSALGALDVDSANVSQPLEVGFADIQATVTESPSWVPDFIVERMVERVVDLYREDLVAYLDSRMRPSLERSLMDASLFAPLELVPIHFGFLANKRENTVDTADTTTETSLDKEDDGT